jgi:hypothetical protein
MPEVHLPNVDEPEDSHPSDASPSATPGTGVRRLRGHSWSRLALEVVLISGGVFLGLSGEAWRERAHHRELAEASLRRFRTELQANRDNIVKVSAQHAEELKAIQDYLTTHGKELQSNLVNPAAPPPQPAPSTATYPPAFQYSAWDVALATQALAYMDPDLAASIAAVYRGQLHYDENVKAITQVMYSWSNYVVWLRSAMNYLDDCVFIDDLMLKSYDDILPKISRALGESSTDPRSR